MMAIGAVLGILGYLVVGTILSAQCLHHGINPIAFDDWDEPFGSDHFEIGYVAIFWPMFLAMWIIKVLLFWPFVYISSGIGRAVNSIVDSWEARR